MKGFIYLSIDSCHCHKLSLHISPFTLFCCCCCCYLFISSIPFYLNQRNRIFLYHSCHRIEKCVFTQKFNVTEHKYTQTENQFRSRSMRKLLLFVSMMEFLDIKNINKRNSNNKWPALLTIMHLLLIFQQNSTIFSFFFFFLMEQASILNPRDRRRTERMESAKNQNNILYVVSTCLRKKSHISTNEAKMLC